MNITDYTHLSALVTNAVLIKGIEANYPTLSIFEQDGLVIDILDLVARMHGCKVIKEEDE